MELTCEEAALWSTRFFNFHDALVTVWRFDYHDGNLVAEIAIEACEAATGKYFLISIVLNDCLTLSYNRSNTAYYEVLTNGMSIVVDGNIVGFDFGDAIDIVNSLDEIRKSRCHVTCRSATWNMTEL